MEETAANLYDRANMIIRVASDRLENIQVPHSPALIQAIRGTDADGNTQPPRPRRRRYERTVIERHQFISYLYALHYGIFATIFGLMYLAGCFTKGDYLAELEFWNMQAANVECPLAIEIWYGAIVVFCPMVCVGAGFLSLYAKTRSNFHSYTLETKYQYYEVWTNSDRRINWTVLGVDVYNLLWAFIGLILNSTAESDTGK
jgi:hypothetical protein